MDLEVYVKRMYGYFTEVNKKVHLIQWKYRNNPIITRGYLEPEENTNTTLVEGGQVEPIVSGGPETPEIPEGPIGAPGTPQQERVFTLEELSQYNGSNNSPAYIAVDGVVYDVSNIARWAGGSHFGVRAGTDATQDYQQCHGLTGVINKLPKIGVLRS